MLQEISRFGNPLCYIFNKFQDWGYMGPKASAFFAAQEFCMAQEISLKYFITLDFR